MAEYKYRKSKESEYIAKSHELLQQMPDFCSDYYNAKHSLGELSKFIYLQRIHIFFQFMINEILTSADEMKDISLEDIKAITSQDVDHFMAALKTGFGSKSSDPVNNRTISNYLSALRSLWDYLEKNSKKDIVNVIKLVERPKVQKKDVVRKYLDENDVHQVLNVIQSGFNMSNHEKSTRTDVSVARDEAIYLTLLHTGLRVSELVGIDLGHLHLPSEENLVKDPCVDVFRKEGKNESVYLSDSAAEAIQAYLKLRPTLHPDKSEKALFLSTMGAKKGTRLSVRSVQRLIKKYAEHGAPVVGSDITPHRIRATYATMMIERTGDLSLVQQLMAHEDPSTTSIYINDRNEAMRNSRNVMDQ